MDCPICESRGRVCAECGGSYDACDCTGLVEFVDCAACAEQEPGATSDGATGAPPPARLFSRRQGEAFTLTPPSPLKGEENNSNGRMPCGSG